MNPHTAITSAAGTKIADHLRRQWPIWAWMAVLLVVNLPLVWGQIRTSMIFLPEAVNGGQWWRLFTYPLVHLSWYHLVLDALGFLLIFTCLDEKRMWVKIFYIIGPAAGALTMTLMLDPSVYQQGLSGLSGPAHGLMAVSAMEMIRQKDLRAWGFASLVVVIAKSTYELWSGKVLFEFIHMGMCGQPLAASHAGGVMGGLAAFILVHIIANIPRNRGAGNIQEPPSRTQTVFQICARTLTRIMYRVHYEGGNRMPSQGPAILICNHVSYVDWLIIASACRRPVHFVMHADIYRLPVLNWIFRMAGVIPVDSGKKNPALLRRSLEDIAAILRSGGIVCLFPEGRLTRTGRIGSFRRGIEKIVQRTPVLVVPLALRGLWGSFFSHKGSPAMMRWPRKLWGRIELAVGDSIRPHEASAHYLHDTIQHLRGNMA